MHALELSIFTFRLFLKFLLSFPWWVLNPNFLAKGYLSVSSIAIMNLNILLISQLVILSIYLFHYS